MNVTISDGQIKDYLISVDLEGLSTEVSENDTMFDPENPYAYFTVTKSAVEIINNAKKLLSTEINYILDMPSGHGRICRALRWLFPGKTIVACDIDRDGVNFCSENFNAVKVYSSTNFNEINFPCKFDLIWCGSLITHLNSKNGFDLLKLLVNSLSNHGLLVLTTHGERFIQNINNGMNYGLSTEQLSALIDQYNCEGYGYCNCANSDDYGMSLTDKNWFEDCAQKIGYKILDYQEASWSDHQDVVLIKKDKNNLNPVVDIEKVKNHWSQKAQVEDFERKKYVAWMNHPFIEKFYINQQISNHPEENWLTYVNKKYVPKPLDLGLTLGCGDGGLERHALVMGMCEQFEAFDVADGTIEVARKLALENGLDSRVKYEVTNINQIQLEPNKYDIAFACMSAHHFSELEHVYSQVREALKPGGFFVLYEYVGPTQFQWTYEQLGIINDLLEILPAKYREYISFPGQFKEHIPRPTIDEMNRIDPSEAIRSDELVPLLAQYFTIVERIDYGGTILQMLLQDIVGNFNLQKEEDIAILNLICYLEETLIKKNILPSDFAFIIAKNINSIPENDQSDLLSDISNEQIAEQIPIRRLIKAIAYKVMTKLRIK